MAFLQLGMLAKVGTSAPVSTASAAMATGTSMAAGPATITTIPPTATPGNSKPGAVGSEIALACWIVCQNPGHFYMVVEVPG
jgi:hypothetical protein